MNERYISVTDDEYVYFLDTTSEDYKTLEDFEKAEFEDAKKDKIDIEEYEDAILQSASDKYWDYVYDNHIEADVVCDLLNEKEKRINQLENYIKSDFISSVCDNCKHVKAYRTSDWFNGVDEDIECLKGHEDMDIDDCIDFEIDLGRYE